MSWRRVRFEPVDGLVASTPRNLTSQAMEVRGEMPASTLAGALKRTLLQANNVLGKPNQDWSRSRRSKQQMILDPKNIELVAPLRWSGNEILWPEPLHLLRDPEYLTQVGRPVATQPAPGGRVSLSDISAVASGGLEVDRGLRLLEIADDQERDPGEELALQQRWITTDSLLYELTRGTRQPGQPGPPDASRRLASDLSLQEQRFGIRRNDADVAEERAFFSRPIERFLERFPARYERQVAGHAALILDRKDQWAESGLSGGAWVRLGGDGRLARCITGVACEGYDRAQRDLDDDQKDGETLLAGREDLAREIARQRRFLLYLATPCCCENGWYPDLNAVLQQCSTKSAPYRVKLVGAAVGKPVLCSGYDRGRPLPVWRAAPAGSVYFFEIVPPKEPRAKKKSHSRDTKRIAKFIVDSFSLEVSLSTIQAEIGLGRTLVGLWPHAPEHRGLAS